MALPRSSANTESLSQKPGFRVGTERELSVCPSAPSLLPLPSPVFPSLYKTRQQRRREILDEESCGEG